MIEKLLKDNPSLPDSAFLPNSTRFPELRNIVKSWKTFVSVRLNISHDNNIGHSMTTLYSNILRTLAKSNASAPERGVYLHYVNSRTIYNSCRNMGKEAGKRVWIQFIEEESEDVYEEAKGKFAIDGKADPSQLLFSFSFDSIQLLNLSCVRVQGFQAKAFPSCPESDSQGGRTTGSYCRCALRSQSPSLLLHWQGRYSNRAHRY